MAKQLPITIATWDYDRVRPIIDGRVKVEGCDVNYVVLPPEECFYRAYELREFEVSEIGFVPYIIAKALGLNPYLAVPVFLSRMFRHSAVYIRTDRGIRSPEDLKGKTVGVIEYQMSAVMWCRGMLADEYGVQPKDIVWRQGGMNIAGRKEKFPLNLPKDFPLEPISRWRDALSDACRREAGRRDLSRAALMLCRRHSAYRKAIQELRTG